MVGMADGYAQASGRDRDRQPAHRARRRQRDGGDLQRPGQPLAAAGHRRPAGAGADHPAGEPDQPRRDPHAAPAGQVVLRAGPGRGRAARPRPRRPPRRRCRRRARSSSRCRWTTGTPRSTRPTRARRSAARSSGRAVADPEAVRALAERLDAATNPVLVAGPDIDASGGWDAAVALAERQRLPVWATPGDRRRPPRLPRGPPQLPRRAAAGDRPGRPDARGPRPDPRRRQLGLPLLPLHPRPAAARGGEAGRDHQRPRRGRPGADGRRDRRRRQADPGGAARGACPSRRRPAPEPNPGPQEIPPSDPLNPSTVHTALAEVFPEDGDRRARVADQHPRPAQPAAPLASRQLLLQRRRRPRLRPRRLGRRAARPARPPGRLRDRRGLGPVRGQRLLERRRLQDARSPSSSCATRSTRSSSGSPKSSRCSGAPGLDLPEARRRRGRRRLRGHGAPGRATATRCATPSPRRSPPRSPELVEVPVTPGMSLF